MLETKECHNLLDPMQDAQCVASGVYCKQWEGGWLVTNMLDALCPVYFRFFEEPCFKELSGHFCHLDQAASCALFVTCFGHPSFGGKVWDIDSFGFLVLVSTHIVWCYVAANASGPACQCFWWGVHPQAQQLSSELVSGAWLLGSSHGCCQLPSAQSQVP